MRARLSKVARARLAAGKVPAAEVGVGLEAGLVRIDLRHDAGRNVVVLDRQAGTLFGVRGWG